MAPPKTREEVSSEGGADSSDAPHPPRCECERCLPESEPTRAEFLSGSERAEMEHRRGHGRW